MSNVNYDTKFTPAQIGKILGVKADLVKKWSEIFKDYISNQSKRKKGSPREFTADDLRVFAYVMMEWEGNPDIVCIKMGLNSENHAEDEFYDLVAQVTPVFQDTSMIRDGENIGMIFVPGSEYRCTHELARSYKLAGDTLVETALKNDQHLELISPILYTYRHAIELYLKANLAKHKQSHDLISLLEGFKHVLKKEFNTDPPEWFDNVVKLFDDFDPGGTTFRYGESERYYEVYIELNHLKRVLTWMADGFDAVRRKRYE